MLLSNEQLHYPIVVVVVVLLSDSMKIKELPPDNCQEVVFPVSVLNVCSFALAHFVLFVFVYFLLQLIFMSFLVCVIFFAM